MERVVTMIRVMRAIEMVMIGKERQALMIKMRVGVFGD